MNEFMSKVNSKIDQFSSHTRGETSNNREVSSNPYNNNHNRAFGATYTPKLLKLDFPRYNEDEVQLWLQLLKQETDNLTWDEFKHHLHSFGPRPLSTERKVSCFASGLKGAIRTEVMANRPTTLSEAISLARLFEAKVAGQKKVSLPTKGVPPALKPPVFSPTIPFGPRHRCKRLFAIQVIMEPEGEDVNIDLESPTSPKMPAISLHAMASMLHPNTMRIHGRIRGKIVLILLDFGSSHNFINESFASRIGLQPLAQGKLEVMVAFGKKLASSGCCTQVLLTLKGVPLNVDLYILLLDGYDIVLGTQWLQALGLVIWDFSRMIMRFSLDGKEVILRGSSMPKDEVVDNFMIEKVT
ncbi:hypothetical protein Pint_24601 [Pistacia integerrima]|uniref:Uncharacterized protein n=1 Tax=Pistacia integerrima TaxID=434235 RepID=A0ACC0YF52_9ROSI|nr:hypothetical protein Pint_24601 [Pistacia integerrima]